ncbi:MAG: beta-N-acetylhexosaminidase [Pseudomonadota bacterium]
MPHTKEVPPGPLVIDVQGLTLNAEDRELIAHPLTGGIVLFARNYDNPAQLADLTQQMRQSRNGPLLISVDQEGGRVQRFKDGFSLIPPMRGYGEWFDTNPQHAREALTDTALLLASELRQHGIDFSYAPVADLDRGLCPAIGNRALHDTIDGVVVLAGAVIDGFAMAGCASVIKHFPGHGGVDVDPHFDFARDQRSRADIVTADMQTFKRLHAKASAIMVAHVVYEQVDQQPATLSAVWQQDILRAELGFAGAIVTDDLSMGAITGRMTQADAAALALSAGSDLALICNEREAQLVAYHHAGIQVGDQASIQRRLSLCARQAQLPNHQRLANAAQAIARLS